MTIQFTKSKGIPHGTFEDEWLAHKRQSEWWYATGYGTGDDGKLYSFQYTLIKAMVGGLLPYYQLQAAVTNCTDEDHRIVFAGADKNTITVSPTKAQVGNEACLEKTGNGMLLTMNENEFSLDVEMKPAKDPVWHCEDGKLRMRVDKPKELTWYYSWTNVPCKGTITIDGKEVAIEGKAWVDKQGGPYSMLKTYTHWEWFSLRFFDGEEAMLFSFPNEEGLYDTAYVDGTYIRADGSYERLNNYTLVPLEFTVQDGIKFACKWKLSAPGFKDERYIITPAIDGQLNLVYYELLAKVETESGEHVGYSFVELLSGARNDKVLSATPKAGEKKKN
ncbi:MAG: hypothetical protein IJI68_04980 [Eggerthellaceae bacterium]|nr:hypothetical protein [Eggerthellaceae bacterium]